MIRLEVISRIIDISGNILHQIYRPVRFIMRYASIFVFRIFIARKRHDAHGKFTAPAAEFLVRTIRIIIQFRHAVTYNMAMKFLFVVVIYINSIKRIFAAQHKFDDREEVAATDKVAQSRGQSSYFTDIYQTDATAGHRQTIGLDPISVIVLGVGGTILLFPIVMFVAVATQLGGVQREKRYAALRLIGATKKQVTRVILLVSTTLLTRLEGTGGFCQIGRAHV